VPHGFIISKIECDSKLLCVCSGSFAYKLKSQRQNTQVVPVRLRKSLIIYVHENTVVLLGKIAGILRYKFKNAGARRLLGWRPVVRGVAQNPIDHPHGGGEGRTSGGRPSVTPWGFLKKGNKTKKKQKKNNGA